MASGIAAFPSSHNVVVPDTEATGNLITDYSRKPGDFALNDYCQLVPVDKVTGLWTEMTVEEAGRIGSTSDADAAWPDGAPRPLGVGHTESFAHKDYRCDRKAVTVPLGNMTVDQCTWDISGQHLRMLAQNMMTRRTRRVLSLLTTSGNWASNHTAAVNAINGGGGTWAAATVANQNIRKSLYYAMGVINDDTLSAVNLKDFQLIVSPALATVMAASAEIVDYMKGSPNAPRVLSGEWGGVETFGLPEYLYGIKVVVEKTAQTTSKRGATAARSQILGNATAVLTSRVGSLVGVEGPSFSTVSLFAYKPQEMLVQKIADPINERLILSVTDTVDAKLTSPVSGFLFTSCQ